MSTNAWVIREVESPWFAFLSSPTWAACRKGRTRQTEKSGAVEVLHGESGIPCSPCLRVESAWLVPLALHWLLQRQAWRIPHALPSRFKVGVEKPRLG